MAVAHPTAAHDGEWYRHRGGFSAGSCRVKRATGKGRAGLDRAGLGYEPAVGGSISF